MADRPVPYYPVRGTCSRVSAPPAADKRKTAPARCCRRSHLKCGACAGKPALFFGLSVRAGSKFVEAFLRNWTFGNAGIRAEADTTPFLRLPFGPLPEFVRMSVSLSHLTACQVDQYAPHHWLRALIPSGPKCPHTVVPLRLIDCEI